MASKYRKKFSLPEGFYPVLEAYCREVLRDQPLDVTEFSYLYFKALEEVSIGICILTDVALQGTIANFNYPKKGKNIPPDRGDRPVSMDEEDYDEEQDGKQDEYDEEGNQEEYGDQEGESYYDENQDGGRDGQEQYYGEEGEGESNL